MKRIPKSAPTLNRMNNGLNQPDDRVMAEPNLDYGSLSPFLSGAQTEAWTAERQDSEHFWEATTRSDIEPEPPLWLQNAVLLYQDVNDNEE